MVLSARGVLVFTCNMPGPRKVKFGASHGDVFDGLPVRPTADGVGRKFPSLASYIREPGGTGLAFGPLPRLQGR